MRTLSTVQAAQVAGPVTTPQYLIVLSLDQDYYLSTRKSVGWFGVEWVADGRVEVESVSPDEATIRLDNLSFEHTANILAGAYAGNVLSVLQGYTTEDVPYIDSDYWAADYVDSGDLMQPIVLFSGVIHSFPAIDSQVVIRAKRLPPKRYPFTRLRPPIANHLPGDGYVVTFDGDTLTVEGE